MVLSNFFVDIKMTFNRKIVNTFYLKTKNSSSMQHQIYPLYVKKYNQIFALKMAHLKEC